MFVRKPAFSATLDHQMANSPEEDPCGFCVTPDNCICRMNAEDRARDDAHTTNDHSPTLPPIDENRVLSSLPLRSSTMPDFLEAPTRATGPGQCDMCISDPERAARCRALAVSNNFESSRATAAVSSGQQSSTASASDAAAARMSCSDFLTRAQVNNVQLGPDVFRRVHVYPYTRQGETGSTHSPAMEIDAHDAAQALADMSRGRGAATDERT